MATLPEVSVQLEGERNRRPETDGAASRRREQRREKRRSSEIIRGSWRGGENKEKSGETARCNFAKCRERRIVSISTSCRDISPTDARNSRATSWSARVGPRITRTHRLRTYHYTVSLATHAGKEGKGEGWKKERSRVYKTFGITKSNTPVEHWPTPEKWRRWSQGTCHRSPATSFPVYQ